KSREFPLILLSAVLFSFSFPPSPFPFLSYFSLVPLLFLLESTPPSKAFRYSYLFGVITNILLLYWIIWQSFYGEYLVLPGSIAAYFILALYPAAWGWLLSTLRQMHRAALWSAPFLWVGLEYLRGLGQIGFPWIDLGYSQTNYLSIIQFATLTGIYGVSFWVVTLNLLIYHLLKARRHPKLAPIFGLGIVILFGLPYFYGRNELKKETSGQNLKVALIQGNIDLNLKWDPEFLDYNFETYDSLTREAGRDSVDLVVWPETACPCFLEKEPVYLNKVEALTRQINCDLVTGTDDYFTLGPERYRFYNSAFYLTPDSGLTRKYHKMALVPFAERIPYMGDMKAFNQIQLGQANFSSGPELELFDSRSGRLAPLICFEIAFPDLVRKAVRSGADYLVNITNDGWFGRTAGPYQHAAMSKMRAVENRISIARCANSGISQAVDPYGRVLAKTSLFERTKLVAKIPKRTSTTFFTKHGPWLGQISLALTLMAVVAIIRRKI
ncbi:MAG: apolipoprotein N-acyltransferase, partial [candidate division Zixibacteria bacterium]|nr:apolipoprotein N-acyltransferase [candidate division Zixibacteria bacterium]